MFEPNKNLASLHRYCTRNQNVDFRGPFLLGTENPSSWELSSQTSLFASKTNVLLMSISICGCCKALRRNASDFAKVLIFGGHLGHFCDAVTSSMTKLARPLSRSFGRIVGNRGGCIVDR